MQEIKIIKPKENKNIPYRKEIDGLRAIAVISVIMFHAGFDVFKGGFIGVDVFFVISGYLITSIIFIEISHGEFNLLKFYERRARRILPALCLVVLISIPFAWAVLLPNEIKDYSQSLIAISFFASNILFWSESGYFETAVELKPLLHTWSLAIEEQFYVIFPILSVFLWRYGTRVVASTVFSLSILSFLISHHLTLTNPSAAFYFLPSRGWELLLGSLAGIFMINNKKTSIHKKMSEFLAIFGLVIIMFSIFYFSKNTVFPGTNALIPTLGTLLIIIFGSENTLVGKLLGIPFLVAVGLVSYSAYLWHQPIFAFARHENMGKLSSNMIIILIILTFSFAYITWKFVESPFRNKKKFKRKNIIIIASIFSLFFISVGTVGSQDQIIDWRFEYIIKGDVGQSEFHKYIDQKFLDCEPNKIAQNAPSWEGFLRCKQSLEGEQDIILLGDSHAEHLFIGIAEALPDKNVVFYIPKADPSIPVQIDGKPYVTNPQFNEIFNYINSLRDGKTILLTMHYIDRIKQNDDLFSGFNETIQFLEKSGHKVIILGDIPKFEFDPSECKYIERNDFTVPSECFMSKVEAIDQMNIYKSTLVKLSYKFKVTYLDISSPLCDNYQCWMVDNKLVLYRDGSHLNIIGSKLIGDFIAQELNMKDYIKTENL